MQITDLLAQTGGLLDQVLAPQATDVRGGNDVLGQIFGSKDVSRTVAQSGALQSGLGSLLDLNGDGNALDDILRMAGKVMR